MERERFGDTLIGPEHNATRDNFDHDGEAKKTTTTTNSASRGAPKGHNPRRLAAAKQTTTIVSRGWPVGARLNFRSLSIQNLCPQDSVDGHLV